MLSYQPLTDFHRATPEQIQAALEHFRRDRFEEDWEQFEWNRRRLEMAAITGLSALSGISGISGGFDPLTSNGVPTAGFSADLKVYSDLGNTPAVNNDPVEQWSDRTSAGNNLTQTTLANRPTWLSTGLDGTRPCLSYNGTSSRLVLSAFGVGSLSQPTTIYVVAKSGSAVSSQAFFDGSLSTARQFLRVSSSAWSYGSPSAAVGGTPDTTSAHVFVCQFNSPASILRIDGAVILAGSTTGTNGLGGLTVGANQAQSTFANVKIAAIWIYPALHTTSQIQAMESYLKTKWATP